MGTGGCESTADANGFVSLNTTLVVALVASQRGGHLDYVQGILKELWKPGASQHLLCISEGTDLVSEHDFC